MADIKNTVILGLQVEDKASAKINDISTTIESLRKRLDAMAAAGQAGTDEFKQLSDTLAQLQGDLGKMNSATAIKQIDKLALSVNAVSDDLTKLEGKAIDVSVDVVASDEATAVIERVNQEELRDKQLTLNADNRAGDVIDEVNAEKLEDKNLNVTAEDKTKPALKSLEEQLNEVKQKMLEMVAAGKQNTKEFQQLSAQAGKLKGQVESVEQTIDAYAKSGSKSLAMVTEAAQGLAAGMAIAQGAAALFGEENEDLQKQMMQLQAGISLLMGVQQAAELINKKGVLTTALMTAGQKAYTMAVNLSNISLKTFRGALIATGIGAAVVAVGLLVANFDKLTAAVQRFIGVKVKENLDGQIKSMERMNELAKAKGETDYQMYLREDELATLRIKNAKNAEERNEAIHARNIIRATETTRQREEEQKKQEKSAEEAKKKEEKRQDDLKKKAEERAAKEKEVNQIIDDARENLLISTLSKNEQELEQIDVSYEERLAKVKGNEEATTLLLQNLRAERLLKIKEQEDTAKKEQDEREAKELEQQKAEIDYKLAVEDEYYAELKKIQDKAKEDEEKAIAAKIATFDFYSQHINAGTSALYAMMEGFGKSGEAQQKRRFNITKQLSIATTLIDTYVAAQKAYLSQMQLTPDSPIRAVIAAAAAVAAGLGRVAKIKSQQFTGGGGGTSDAGAGGGGGGNMGGQALPPPTATNPNAQLLNPPANGQGQGMRAYVVESDIRSVSGRLRRMSEFATLGA